MNVSLVDNKLTITLQYLQTTEDADAIESAKKAINSANSDQIISIKKCLEMNYLQIKSALAENAAIIIVMEWSENASAALTYKHKHIVLIKEMLLSIWKPCNDFQSLIPIIPPNKYDQEIDVPQLNSNLMKYQKEAVLWLEDCEKYHRTEPFWIQINDLYYNLCSGRLSSKLPTAQNPGGILADEMGLGKTVMMIALILRHPRPQHLIKYANESKTTLILCPGPILKQWTLELRKFAPALKVFHYCAQIDDSENFHKYDIVICAIEILRKEFYFAMPESDRKLRYTKKYRSRKSPLTNLTWWRIILDEAQMVDSASSNTSEMAAMIPRINSWTVTGTPASKTSKFSDLANLFRFSKLFETTANYFNNMACLSIEYVRSEMCPFIHSQTKANISDQIKIPEQVQQYIELDFENIEEVYYEDLSKEANELISKLYYCYKEAVTNGEEDKGQRNLEILRENMRSWILRLRQTCCHPQISSANKQALGGPMSSIKLVLEQMVKQCTAELHSAERQAVLQYIEKAHLLEVEDNYSDALEILLKQLKNGV